MWSRHEHHHEREQHAATLTHAPTVWDYVGMAMLAATLFALLTLTVW